MEITPEEDRVIRIAARKFIGLPNVSFDDLLQEGRIAWFKNLHQKELPDWHKILYTCVCRAIQRRALPFAFELPRAIVRLTHNLKGDTIDEQALDMAHKMLREDKIKQRIINKLKKADIEVTEERILSSAIKKAKAIIPLAEQWRAKGYLEEE